MLKLPNPLPPLENLFVSLDGCWHLTKRAKTELGPIFEEVGLDLNAVKSPDEFREYIREVMQRRVTLAFFEIEVEQIATELESIAEDIVTLFVDALKKDHQDQLVAERRKGFKLVD